MQSIFCHPLDIYQQVHCAENNNLKDTILQSMSPGPLILYATVIVHDGNLCDIHDNSNATTNDYENWKYFIGHIEQFAEGSLRVQYDTTIYQLIDSRNSHFDLSSIQHKKI
jgi:hypothetical protein